MEALDGAPMVPDATDGVKIMTITGESDVDFGWIAYEKAGTYQYRVTETRGTVSGYTYDMTIYTMTVTVTENAGKFVSETKIVDETGALHNVAVFRNKYEAPTTEKPVTEKPVTEKPVTEKPGTEKPGTEKPGTEKPGTEKPGTEKPGTERPGTEKPGTERPGTDKPTTKPTQKPSTGGSGGKRPSSNPRTGDAGILLSVLVAAGSLGALIAVERKRRKK